MKINKKNDLCYKSSENQQEKGKGKSFLSFYLRQKSAQQSRNTIWFLQYKNKPIAYGYLTYFAAQFRFFCFLVFFLLFCFFFFVTSFIFLQAKADSTLLMLTHILPFFIYFYALNVLNEFSTFLDITFLTASISVEIAFSSVSNCFSFNSKFLS